MATQEIVWPRKRREILNSVLDSRRWNDFEFRRDDIVIASWAKSGTTLTQQIVAQLIFNGAEDVYGQQHSPWIDFQAARADQILAAASAQTHRRFLKTHLPIDALVFSPHAKYIYVGRDARDVAWSIHHHHSILSETIYAMLNPPHRTWAEFPRHDPDIRRAYHAWLDGDGYPWHPFWSHVQGWWGIRSLPNVKLLHFNGLRSDLAACVREIAQFLDIAIDEAKFPRILAHCDIEYMRRAAARYDFLNVLFVGGGASFIYKGTNGRWRDILSTDEIAKADLLAAKNLTPDCAHWLKTGELRGASSSPPTQLGTRVPV